MKLQKIVLKNVGTHQKRKVVACGVYTFYGLCLVSHTVNLFYMQVHAEHVIDIKSGLDVIPCMVTTLNHIVLVALWL